MVSLSVPLVWWDAHMAWHARQNCRREEGDDARSLFAGARGIWHLPNLLAWLLYFYSSGSPLFSFPLFGLVWFGFLKRAMALFKKKKKREREQWHRRGGGRAHRLVSRVTSICCSSPLYALLQYYVRICTCTLSIQVKSGTLVPSPQKKKGLR